MRFPSKATPFARSIFIYFPLILSHLESQDKTPVELIDEIGINENQLGDFMSALDCLYALGQIDFNEKGMELHYVGKSTM